MYTRLYKCAYNYNVSGRTLPRTKQSISIRTRGRLCGCPSIHRVLRAPRMTRRSIALTIREQLLRWRHARLYRSSCLGDVRQDRDCLNELGARRGNRVRARRPSFHTVRSAVRPHDLRHTARTHSQCPNFLNSALDEPKPATKRHITHLARVTRITPVFLR